MKAVAIYYLCCRNFDTGIAAPGAEAAAAFLGLSVATVRRALKAACAAGLMRNRGRSHGHTLYSFPALEKSAPLEASVDDRAWAAMYAMKARTDYKTQPSREKIAAQIESALAAGVTRERIEQIIRDNPGRLIWELLDEPIRSASAFKRPAPAPQQQQRAPINTAEAQRVKELVAGITAGKRVT